jgi:hypothetical protein
VFCLANMDTHVCELPVPSWREAHPHRWSLSLPLVGSRRAKLALGWREAPGGGTSTKDTAPTRHIVRAAHDVPSLPTKWEGKKERASLVSRMTRRDREGVGDYLAV